MCEILSNEHINIIYNILKKTGSNFSLSDQQFIITYKYFSYLVTHYTFDLVRSSQRITRSSSRASSGGPSPFFGSRTMSRGRRYLYTALHLFQQLFVVKI